MSSNDYLDRWYSEGYSATYNVGLIGRMYALVYRYMEYPHRHSHGERILEVGAGSGVYRESTCPAYGTYTELDIREWPPPPSDQPNLLRVVGDAENLENYGAQEFDRVIATCLLVHLDNPHRALLEWKRVVRSGGSLTIYVPPEAGWLVRVARFLGPWQIARRKGYEPTRLAYLEHKYSYFHLDALIKEVFRGDFIRRRTFPFRAFKFDLALFHVYEIQLKS